MVVAGVRCRLNKTQLFLSTFWQSLGREGTSNCAAMFAPASALGDESDDALQRFRSSLASTISDEELQLSRQFCLPGEVVLLRTQKRERGTLSGPKRYEAVWVTAADLQAEGLVLSPNMLLEHMPDVSTAILEATAKRMANSGS